MDFSNPFKRSNLIILGVIAFLLVAIPLGTTLLQRQTQLNSRASNNVKACGACDDGDAPRTLCIEADTCYVCPEDPSNEDDWVKQPQEACGIGVDNPGDTSSSGGSTGVENCTVVGSCTVLSDKPVCNLNTKKCEPCSQSNQACGGNYRCNISTGKCVDSGSSSSGDGSGTSGSASGKVTTCKGERDIDGFLAEISRVSGKTYNKADAASVRQAITDYNNAACSSTSTGAGSGTSSGSGASGSSTGSTGGSSAGGSSGGGSSSGSGSGAQSGQSAVKPATPTGLYGHCRGTQGSAFWNSSENATSYNLKIDNNASGWRGTSVYFGATAGSSYQLSVQAVNGSQTSDYSTPVTVTCQ